MIFKQIKLYRKQSTRPNLHCNINIKIKNKQSLRKFYRQLVLHHIHNVLIDYHQLNQSFIIKVWRLIVMIGGKMLLGANLLAER